MLVGLIGVVGLEVVNDATVKRRSCDAKVFKRCSAEDQGDKLATTLGEDLGPMSLGFFLGCIGSNLKENYVGKKDVLFGEKSNVLLNQP